MKLIYIIFIIFIIIIIKSDFFTINEYFLNTDNRIDNRVDNIPKIPKVIYQTYYDKSKIPIKVFKNISKYSRGYKHIIYDDNDCMNFLIDNYPPIVLNTFKSLNLGAYKADLFRYCILYKYGGIYLDIKTELIQPIDKLFPKSMLYTVIALNKKTIYQGIIATPPRNPIFKKLINHIITNVQNKSIKYTGRVKDYHIFTKYFFDEISGACQNEIRTGLNINKDNNINFYLFHEKCSRDKSECYDGLDRHNFCCNIYDKHKKIIKTRYSDYPWK